MFNRAATALLLLTGPAVTQGADAPRSGPPNVVVIFADDLGYGDLGCYGAKGWATPNLDRLAADGVRFTDFYAAQPVCSASRTGLLTGCYPNRLGLHGALGPGATHGIADAETTLAEVLKAKGYATAAVGKWHLGHRPPFLPTRHGFDRYFGLPYSNDMWPHHPEAKPGAYPPLPLFDGEKVVDPDVSADAQRTLTARYTERAVKFVADSKGKPFFLYLAHSFPHVPLFVGDKFKNSSKQGAYGDVIQEIDWSVGEVLKAVKDAGAEGNTLVVFTSDNGPWLSYGNHAGGAGPLREGKGTTWEGGVRVPCVARWPGTIPAGSVQAEPAMTIDLLPTVAKLAGADLPKLPIDGKDVGPLLRCEKGAKSPQAAYYFYFGTNELQAVRAGRWKLVLPHTYRSMAGQEPGKDGKPGRYRQEKVGQELYDLAADVGESTDVSAKHPEVVKRLLADAEAARADLGDALTGRTGAGTRQPGRVK
jgi:arylsulfatase